MVADPQYEIDLDAMVFLGVSAPIFVDPFSVAAMSNERFLSGLYIRDDDAMDIDHGREEPNAWAEAIDFAEGDEGIRIVDHGEEHAALMERVRRMNAQYVGS